MPASISTIHRRTKVLWNDWLSKEIKVTVKQTYNFVKDCTRMAKHVVDRELPDKDTMSDFIKKVTKG
jgi:hypothetical protein